MMDVGLCVMPAQCSCMDHLGNEVLVRNKSKMGMGQFKVVLCTISHQIFGTITF